MRSIIAIARVAAVAPVAAVAAVAVAAVVAVMAALTLMGCASADPTGSASSATTAPCGVTVMAQNCALAGCHLNSPEGAAQANLELSPGALGDGHQLVNAPAQGSFCLGTMPAPVIIDPHKAENSLLYNKLQTQPVCGPEMPYLRPQLSPDKQQCILDWIRAVPGVE
jgi:hypothetical protein